jgi:hypothetical protein
MKTIIKTLIILCITFANGFVSYAQVDPPQDQSSYTDYYGCSQWTTWSNWITVYAKFAETGDCQMYAMYKVRHCVSDPTIIEVWIGQHGIIPPIPGEDCETALHYLYPNWPSTTPMDYDHAQKLKMKFYVQAVTQEFTNIPVQNRPICGQAQPIKYGMRFPGSCTMFCAYEKDGQPPGILKIHEKACYETYCCGNTYSVCWDPLTLQPVITTYQNGSTTGNCDLPTGNPPTWRCDPVPDGYHYKGATECSNSCNYGG